MMTQMGDTWPRVQLERTIRTLRASTGSVSSRSAIMAATKCVRKLQRPRPLLSMQPPVCDPKKTGTPMSFPAEDVDGLSSARVSKQMLDLCASLGSGNYDARTLSQIAGVCNLLKVAGAAMEPHFGGDLDRCFDTFRNADLRNEVPILDRVRLLEVIELRANGWKSDKDMDEYYARKYEELGSVPSKQDASAVQQACALQQAAQNEQLSHTETAELEAKATAPPVSGTTVDFGEQPKTPSTVADGERKEFTRSVLVGTEVLLIVGANEDTVRMAASVLHSFFTNLGTDTSSHLNQTPSCVPSGPSEALVGESVARPLSAMSQSSSTADAPSALSAFDRCGITSGCGDGQFKGPESFHEVPQPVLKEPDCPPPPKTYSREFLLQCSRSPLAGQLPLDFPALDPAVHEVPQPALKEPDCPPLPKTYSREFLLHCSRSPLAGQLPLDFPALDPAVACTMVREDRRQQML